MHYIIRLVDGPVAQVDSEFQLRKSLEGLDLKLVKAIEPYESKEQAAANFWPTAKKD